MHPILRRLLAVIGGIIVGSLVNLGFIQLGHTLFPIEGVDLNDMEALAQVMPTLSWQYFLFPFLAHALGTLTGAFTVAYIVKQHSHWYALAIGVWFLLGGIMASMMIPAPVWFVVTDLVLAYLPTALAGGLIAKRMITR